MRVFRVFCIVGLLVMLFSPECPGNSDIIRFAEEGTAAYEAGDYAVAINAWQAGLEEAQRSGSARQASVFLYPLGLAYEQLNRYEEALDYYQQALQLRRQLDDVPGQIKVLNNLGIVSDKISRYEQALDLYQQALALIRQNKDIEAEGRTLTNIGIIYFHAGRYAAALDSLQQALTLYRQIGKRGQEASVLNNIGDIYERWGRYQEALNAYRQALSLQQQFDETDAQGRTLNNIGVIYWRLAQYDEALAYYNLALASKRAAGDRRGEAATLNNIGVVHWKQKAYQEALDSYEQALRLRHTLNDSRGQGSTLTNIGMIHAAEGRLQEAWEAFRQALSITRTIGDRLRESLILTQLGKLYKTTGDPEQAYEAFRAGVTLSAQLRAREIQWEALRGLAAAEVERQQFQKALQHYEQAIEQIETLRTEFRASEEYWALMEDKLDVYDECLLLLSQLHQRFPDRGYDQKAFEIFERRQGRMFLEQMGKTGARRFAGLPEAVRQQEEHLDIQLESTRSDLKSVLSQSHQNPGRIAQLEQRLAAFQAEQRELHSRIQISYPEYHALRYPQPVSLDDLRHRVLQPDELMLVYHVMPANTMLWVIGAKQMYMHVLPAGERDIQQQVANMRHAMLPKWAMNPDVERLYNPVPAQNIPFVEASYTLFSTLFPQNLRALLTQGRPVYIVPTGVLYGIPFEALLTRPAERLENAHFLLEDAVISYLSSASLLKTLRNARTRAVPASRYPFLAFAHPDYRLLLHAPQMSGATRSLQIQAVVSAVEGEVSKLELPDTEIEARAVAALFQPPPESRPLQLRQDASCENVFRMNAASRLDEYQYIMFSLHGLIPGEVSYVEQPALMLSDDLLLMSEVFELSLNADMIMLSACNTGRGKYQRGEGVMGLTRAFMYAGTPATTVTLWSVESKSAKDMSVGMFSHLKQGLAPAPALRAIKLQLLRGEKGELFTHPFFWSPFVLFGEGFF